MSSRHPIPYFTCDQWSACAALCIIPAGSPFPCRESLDPAKCFLHHWMQLWATGCTVPNTVCWRRLALYSAGVFFSFLHVNISANLSSGFLAAVSLKKKKCFVTYKTWKWEFQWRVGSSVSKILFAGVFWPRSRAQKMPQSLSVRNTAGIQAGQHSKLVLNRLVDKNYSAKEVMSNF